MLGFNYPKTCDFEQIVKTEFNTIRTKCMKNIIMLDEIRFCLSVDLGIAFNDFKELLKQLDVKKLIFFILVKA